jgi:transcriptional regulator with XRE-family HTH domain
MTKRHENKMPDRPSVFSHESAMFGSFVREQRIGAGLSRSLLAQRPGISHAVVENSEYGRVTATYSNVRALAKVFGLSERRFSSASATSATESASRPPCRRSGGR